MSLEGFFAQRIQKTRQPPCRLCKHERRCGLHEMACAAFHAYVMDRGGNRSRKPSAEIYKRIFQEDDDE